MVVGFIFRMIQMDREKLIVIIITVAVIAGALGLVLGGVFTRPARKAFDAEIADIRAMAILASPDPPVGQRDTLSQVTYW